MKDLICARDVEALAQAGESVCRIACGTIITPSARDAAEALGVTFEEKSAPEAAAAATCSASQEIDSSQIYMVLKALMEKGLLEEAGRLELPGRPIAYRTGDTFLRTFGLHSLDELPAPPEEEEQQTLL